MRRGRPAGLVDTQHGEDKSDCVVVGVSSRWNAAADETANPLSPTVHTESPKLADRLTAAGAVRPGVGSQRHAMNAPPAPAAAVIAQSAP